MPKDNLDSTNAKATKNSEGMEIEIVDFSDLEQIEESIAPIFVIPAVGGSCSGAAPSGCVCNVP